MSTPHSPRLTFTLALASLGLALAAGCIDRTGAPLIIAHGPADQEAMVTAPVDGDYILYRKEGSKSAFEDAYMARTHLHAGDPIGFKSNVLDTLNKPIGTRGTVSAVAGEMANPVNPSDSYEWRRIPGSSNDTKSDHPFIPRP